MSSPEQLPETDRLSDLARKILTAVELAAIEHSIVLPKKRILSAGESVHDCPLVSVTALNLQVGLPDAPGTAGAFGASGCQPIWTAVFLIEIVQPAPLWPADDDGVVLAQPINEWFTEFISPMTGVLLSAVTKIPSFGEHSLAIRYAPPTGGYGSIVGTLTIPMP